MWNFPKYTGDFPDFGGLNNILKRQESAKADGKIVEKGKVNNSR
jgi:hypothetical protein